MKPIVLSIFLLGISISAFGQPCTGKTVADFDNSNQRIFRAYYDNDYFLGTNQYYTQGIKAELIAPAFKEWFLSRNFLYRIGRRATTYYGVRVQHKMFTPVDISNPEPVFGDHPYAGFFTFDHFLISNHTQSKQRLTTSIELGLLGPVAGGGVIVRRTVDPEKPQGWENQIKTDVIVGYKALYEKGFVEVNGVDVLGQAGVKLSTLETSASLGLKLRLGLLNPYFYELHFSKKSTYLGRDILDKQVYLYVQGHAKFIGYDATLQGGVFNRSSIPRLTGPEISRIYPDIKGGVEVIINDIGFGAEYAFQGKRFLLGSSHQWLGFKFMWVL